MPSSPNPTRYLIALTVMVMAGVLMSCDIVAQRDESPNAKNESGFLSGVLPGGGEREPPTKEEIKARAEALETRDTKLLFTVGLCEKGGEIINRFDEKMAQKMKVQPQFQEVDMSSQPTADGTVPSDEEIMKIMKKQAMARSRGYVRNRRRLHVSLSQVAEVAPISLVSPTETWPGSCWTPKRRC